MEGDFHSPLYRLCNFRLTVLVSGTVCCNKIDNDKTETNFIAKEEVELPVFVDWKLASSRKMTDSFLSAHILSNTVMDRTEANIPGTDVARSLIPD